MTIGQICFCIIAASAVIANSQVLAILGSAVFIEAAIREAK